MTNILSDLFREQNNFLSEPAEEYQKTYWYHKDWRDYIVDSNLFYIRPGHHNPTSMPLFSETHIAENVRIGWLYLGNKLYFVVVIAHIASLVTVFFST